MRRSMRRHIPDAAPIFQEEAHEALRQGARNGHRQMLMATGRAGRPSWGLRAIHEALQKGKRAIFICDRRTLIEQTSAVADSYGLTAHSVLMADPLALRPVGRFRLPALRRSHAANGRTWI